MNIEEELNDVPYLDRHGRFNHAASRRDCLESTKRPDFESIYYPNNKKFAIGLTHDIDIINFSYKDSLEYYYKLGARGLLKFPLYLARQKTNPFWNIADIKALEERYGAQSTFFIMTSKRDLNRSPNYDARDLESDLHELFKKQGTIGLHGGYYSYDDVDALKEEKQALEEILDKSIIGCRNHYLRFKTPDTWKVLEDAGFSYDSTFGYADFVGFRGGSCYPFKPPNADILEIPLNIMDCSLFAYMNLDEEVAWQITKRLIDTTELQHGVLTVLWHNTYMVGKYKAFYEKILAYGNERRAWMTGTDQIYNWWKLCGY